MSTLSRSTRSDRSRFNAMHFMLITAVVITILWTLAATLGALWIIGNAWLWLVTL